MKRLVKPVLFALAATAFASPAMAQGVTAGVVVDGIASALGLLQQASWVLVGGGGGGTFAYQAVKWLIDHRAQIRATTEAIKATAAGHADASTAGTIDQAAHDVVLAIIGAKQTAASQSGQPAPTTLDPNDADKALGLFKTVLMGRGIALPDSDELRGKLNAVLGSLALKLPFPVPGPPKPA